MARKLWQDTATKLGEKLAADMEITSLPVNPKSIAAKKGIVVQPLPGDRKTVSGMLVRSGDIFGIQYATYLDNEGFENFSIAHELGHYQLPRHPEALLQDGLHQSQAGFRSGDRYELEADHFAAGLLMPQKLFRKELDKHQSGLAAIEALSNSCETSLTATAIRYAQLTPDPVAVVVSEGNLVDYCFMSEEFSEIPGLEWLRKGSPLPECSPTLVLNNSPQAILQNERAEGDATLGDWFACNLAIEMYEECIGLGRYGKTLTVLSIEELPDAEELEERSQMERSWTPRFKR